MTAHAAVRKPSERLAALKPSATVEMTDRVRQARAAGRKVIGLSSKFASVASVIGVTEFTGAALLVNAREFQPVPIIVTVALTYLVLCYGLSLAGRLLYRRLGSATS